MARVHGGRLAERSPPVSEQPDFSTHPGPRRPPLRAVAAVVVALLALGAALHTAWSARRTARVAQDRLAEVRREVGALEARVQAFGARNVAGGDLLNRAAAAGESPPERIVAELARALPEAARLERLNITYGEAIALELRVVARNARAWDLTLSRLEETRFLEEVSPGPERRDGEVRTTVTARWVEGP